MQSSKDLRTLYLHPRSLSHGYEAKRKEYTGDTHILPFIHNVHYTDTKLS